MGNTENKGQQLSQSEKTMRGETNAERSFAEFFNKLSETLELLKNSQPRPEDPKLAKRFEVYSQAFSGFAQKNVSKAEGFAINVKTDANYDMLTRRLVNRKRARDEEGAQCQDEDQK